MVLQELDLHINYRPGKTNSNADALLRAPVGLASALQSCDSPVVLAAVWVGEKPAKDGDDCLEKRQRRDPNLALVIDYLESGTLPEETKKACELVLTQSQYEIVDGVLYHVEPDKTLRMIPPTSDRKQIFEEAHSGAFGGHLWETKVHGQLSRHYWWPRMRADITHWCWACLTCISRHVGQAVKPPLTPIPVAGPFDRLGVDVIKFPMSSSGNQYAVVFVDYLTKWPEVFATPDQSALTIARLLVEQVISRHGVPAELLSDREKVFLSKLLHEVYGLMGMKKVNTTAYHPQTDGLVERFNRTLMNTLAKTVKKNGSEHLPYVLYAYRVYKSPQRSLRSSFCMGGILCSPQSKLFPHHRIMRW